MTPDPADTPTTSRRRLFQLGAAGAGAAVALPASPAAAASFRDVSSRTKFAKEIRWMADKGYAKGWPDGTYRPLANVARDAFAAFLYRLQGSPRFTPPATSPFRDVAPSNQFYREITWAQAKGYVTGWSDGTFRPLTPVTRDAAVAIFYRLAGRPTIEESARYTDVPVGTKFRGEIGWARNIGLMTGWADGTFRPTRPIARDAMAALVYRYVNGGIFGRNVVVMGAIARKYWAEGGPDGPLGLPEGNAREGVSGVTRKKGKRQDFAGGVITYRRGVGAYMIRTPMRGEWNRAGYIAGSLGFARGDATRFGAGWRQSFEGGVRTAYQGWNPPERYHGPILKVTPVKGGIPIRRGWNGTRVRIIQRKLGVHRTGPRQTYDYETEQAVRAFQRRNGLTADGVVGAATWRRLAPEYPFTMDSWQTSVRAAANATRNQRIEEMIRFARSCLRSPYTWGGAGWSNHRVAGYDCSGLVLQALYSAGLDPQPINVVAHAEPTYRTSQMLYADKKLASYPIAQRRRGDLIFWADNGGIVRHVAIYLGNGRIIEAFNSSRYGGDVHERPYAYTLMPGRTARPLIKRPFV